MIASFGIILMHVRANTDLEISGNIYNTLIPSFTNLVFLFMTVSAFGMCCGYYDKVQKNEVDLTVFYGKRFKKIFPFFGMLVLLDVILSPSRASFYEGFADLTLVFGFLQKPIEVIGVGWFLGLVFVFYIIFPFFCVLLGNKRRGWCVFVISLIYNYACINYFDVPRTNILYSACYFLAGGLIFLYRDMIQRLNQWCSLGAVWIAIVLYYLIGGKTVLCLLVSTTLLVYTIIKRGGILENRVTKFFGSISMEIYLSHMVIFRVVEKLKLDQILGNGWLRYIATSVLVIAGTTVFSVVMQRTIRKVMEVMNKRKLIA